MFSKQNILNKKRSGQNILNSIINDFTTPVDYWRDKKIFWALLAGLLINIFFWLALRSLISSLENPIPLHYNIYFGVDLLGDKQEIFKLSFIASLIFLINFVLSFIIYHKEKLLSYFFVFSGVLVQVMLFIFSLLIINL